MLVYYISIRVISDYINNLNNQNITKENKKEIFQREDINESNVFLCYNCNRNQFFKEKQIIDTFLIKNEDFTEFDPISPKENTAAAATTEVVEKIKKESNNDSKKHH